MLFIAAIASSAAQAETSPKPVVPVTADNFNRAESDLYFAESVKESGGVGMIFHHRDVMPIDKQTVIRANRDTAYSSGVFDLDAGPVTVTLPDTHGRFMSMMVLNEDQYSIETVYAPGAYTYSKDKVGTRYVMLGLRTFVNPDDPKDLAKAHALQDAVKVTQHSRGTFEVPNWDKVSEKKVRDALLVLGSTIGDTEGMFGPKGAVDPIRHLIGTATGWGGNAPKDATYIAVVPARNDGKTIYRLNVKDVPVDGFWSISVYDRDGYFQKNTLGAYSLNNVTAKKSAGGAVDIQFGGCDSHVANCLPITPGWNYWVRLYRPHESILNGTWKFPEAQPKD
ncbi:DUF1254 domain-containing protein [Paraburkholderia sp. J67]|uniref:DUF1254 domain-containing protein n=1 Tax=Paraburkholderia sp. J67 TaxID=2805435 RepID=UPI002ABE722E|nr:DUF1254 domain-containing protein [Paraburkholderia sp. J67]